jgi:hypothetical protein
MQKIGQFSGLDRDVCIETMQLGKNLSQCPLCHELFSTERNFVLHRVPKSVGNNPGTYNLGKCRDPESKGLALSNRGVYKMAPSEKGYIDGAQ